MESTLSSRMAAGADKRQIIRVSATSSIKGVAGQVSAMLRAHDVAHVEALGAVAVNRTIKALAMARESLLGENIGIACTPQFIDVEAQYQTGVCFTVKSCVSPGHQAARTS